MKAVSPAQLNHILSLLDARQSSHQISSITGVHHSTISILHHRHHSYLQKSLGGCPSQLTPVDTCYAQHLISSRNAENAVKITKTLQNIKNQPLSSKPVHWLLKEAGMKAVVKRKKPILTKCHRRKWLDFTIAHQDWIVEDWKWVGWLDETKINRLWSFGKKWVSKKAGEGLSDQLEEGMQGFGGGSVMIWGCMTWEGPGCAVKGNGRMDGDIFVKILDENLIANPDYYDKNAGDIIFQQDNDPKYTCKQAQEWFIIHEITFLPWPAQSLDLNLTDN